MAAEDGLLARWNGLNDAEARVAFTRCCGAARWVDGMLAARPFTSATHLFEMAEAVWSRLGAADFLEAFSHHPEIGANLGELRKKFAGTAALSQAEQAGALSANEETLVALREQNRAYRERFGYAFIVCATGRTAAQMLALLEARLGNDAQTELAVAAAEQAKITRLRLEKV